MNIISVDLEDWYHLGFAEEKTERMKSIYREPLIVNNTLRILQLFKMFGTRATFFVLGLIAETYPDLIKEIKNNNHEIASHGYNHTPVFKLTPQEFEYEIKKSSEVLSHSIGQRMLGYRAPHLSMHNSFWALAILKNNGFVYDSSLKFIPAHWRFKEKESCYEIELEQEKVILEFPVSTVNLMGFKIAFSGGTYFRMLPKFFIQRCMKGINKKKKLVHIYLHPRDVEQSLPKLHLSVFNQLRYSGHCGDTVDKIKYLLSNFRFTSIKEYLENS